MGLVPGLPSTDASLLTADKKLFVRARPQYETLSPSSFLIATEEGISHDGKGDQSAAINRFLAKAWSRGLVAYFPAGVYQVQDTIFIPTGSRVLGSSWSQIVGTGPAFENLNAPRVMVQVGNEGDMGTMEISDMLWTVKGSTQGAILMKWNVHESSQGSAAMWDSHFRVGGAKNSDLDISTCKKGSFNEKCIAASLLLHVTTTASGYFENVFLWTSDHDNDMHWSEMFSRTDNQINVYSGRGLLIESQGPSWFYASAVEHSTLYQCLLYNAKNIFFSHLQTESPYFQPMPAAPKPFHKQQPFPGDPNFGSCKTDSCRKAWAIRIIKSSNIYIYGLGLYSFFNNYASCVADGTCQDHLMQVRGVKDVLLWNIFTIGSSEVANGPKGVSIPRNTTQR
jgi:hypothetical protein